ncbi:MAG: transposase [Clostridiales bacterium]|nr:transposase [Clostridiales bacterium]NLY60459.1 transposase [Clostridiales bacterium]
MQILWVQCIFKKETYYGFKLHFIITLTLECYLTDFLLTSANIEDRESLRDLLAKHNFLTILGDKGYFNKDFSDDLKLEKNIDLIPIVCTG